MLKPITKRESVAQSVARQLIDLVLSGELEAGDKLPSENELCELFRVGRGTVREALRALQVIGLIAVERGRGNFVRERTAFWVGPLTLGLEGSADLRSLTESRRLIEVELAGLASERARHEDVKAIEDILGRLTKSLGPDQKQEYLEADVEFHFAIAKASGNPILRQCLGLIRSLMHEWFTVTWMKMGVASAALGEHRAIFEAIRRKDKQAAKEAMALHLAASKMRLSSARRVNNNVKKKSAGKAASQGIEVAG